MREDSAARRLGDSGAGWELRGTLWLRARERLTTCLTSFRQIVGMPDYPAYLRHLQQRHPDWPVPSERDFFDLYVQSRYGNGGSRCC